MSLNRLGDLTRAGSVRAKVVELGKFIDPDARQYLRQLLDCRCDPVKVALPTD
jgi:hypothetical protein